MPRPCEPDHPQPQPETCTVCRLFVTREDYRRLWSGGPGACRHLREPTGETVLCPSCRGHVELKLFACAVHGRCTAGKAVPGVTCCQGCPDYEPQPGPPDGSP